MKAPVWLVCLVTLSVSTLLLAACGTGGGKAAASDKSTPAVPATRTVAPTPTPTPTATPRATPRPIAQVFSTPTPTPTPSPVTSLTSAEVTQLVYLRVRSCADKLGTIGNRMELSLTSDYSTDEKQGRVGVTDKGGALTFGQYRVSDATGEVTSAEIVAAQILQSGVTCADPVARLTQGPVSPKILIPSTPTPEPPPVSPGVTEEQAEARIWIAVYDCFDPKPKRISFKVYAENPQRWLVEGKEETVTRTFYYGLWTVNATTGIILPWDNLARATANQACFRQP